MTEHFNSASVRGWRFFLSSTKGPFVTVMLQRVRSSIQAPKIALPRMKAPYGVQTAMGAASNTRANKNMELNIVHPLLKELLESASGRMLEFVLEGDNRVKLFGSALSDEEVSAKHRPIVIESTNELYGPRIRVKIAPTQKVQVFVSAGVYPVRDTTTDGTLADIHPGDDVIATVKLVPYVHGGYFGISCTCTDAVLHKRVIEPVSDAPKYDANEPEVVSVFDENAE